MTCACRLFRWFTWKAATHLMSSGAMIPIRSIWERQWARRKRSQSCRVDRRMASASPLLTDTTLVRIADSVDSSSFWTSERTGIPAWSKSAWPALGSATLPGRKAM